MVDIHSHILWGMDDGPESLDESVAMLRVAAAAGTSDIVATPHANSRYPFDPALISARIEELASHSGLPRVHRGCDFHLSAINIEDALLNPTRYTINGGRYLMVELPEMFSPDAMGHALRSLYNEGMLPVLTHPERNPVLQRSPETVTRWIENGILVQVTAQSFLGRFGQNARKFAWHFLRASEIHFVASDGHDPVDRPPRLDLIHDALSREVGGIVADQLLISHPCAAIEDTDDPIHACVTPKPRPWYQFWQR